MTYERVFSGPKKEKKEEREAKSESASIKLLDLGPTLKLKEDETGCVVSAGISLEEATKYKEMIKQNWETQIPKVELKNDSGSDQYKLYLTINDIPGSHVKDMLCNYSQMRAVKENSLVSRIDRWNSAGPGPQSFLSPPSAAVAPSPPDLLAPNSQDTPSSQTRGL